jgi:RNA-directed DNA polymerase
VGLAALEDKRVHQAVVTILQPISEEAFRGFSSGFRPGRRPHHAVDALAVALTRRRVHDVLAYDMRAFFDTRAHAWSITCLQPRVADPRVLRLVQQWRRAGVSEEGQWSETLVGVPPGAVVSPCLGHVSLHDGFDLGVEAWRQKVAQGDVVVVRDADDGVVGFERRADAERCLADVQARFPPFGLEVHPDHTRLIECGPHAKANRRRRGEGKPETFDVLGVTPIGARHWKTGYLTVRRKTARKRMVATLQALHQPLRPRRHEPIARTGQWRGSVVQGDFNDHAVPGHRRTLGPFRRRVIRLWRRQLCLRRQKTRLNWRRFTVRIHRWIPTQRLLPPFPSVRFDARPPRSEPYAVVPHVRICAGGAG